MSLIAFGTNVRRAPVELVEALSLPAERLDDLLLDVHREGPADGIVALATCHRVEFVVSSREVCNARKEVMARLARAAGIDLETEKKHFDVWHDAEAAGHVFRVAGGVDSLVVGERQILGQVRRAAERARALGVIDAPLLALFHRAVTLGRRVRHRTRISRGNVSLASLAAEIALRDLPEGAEKRVVLVGAGETARLAGCELAKRGGSVAAVVNRGLEHARLLASAFNAEALALEELESALEEADVAVFATSAQEALLSPGKARRVVARRGGRGLVVVDLGLPRNVSPEVAEIGGLRLIGMHDLESASRGNLERRQAEADRVSDWISQEVEAFMRWRQTVAAQEMAESLYRKVESIRREHLDRYAGSFPPHERERLETLTQSLLRSVFHEPALFIRSLEGETERGQGDIDLIRRLFNLTGEREADLSESGREDLDSA